MIQLTPQNKNPQAGNVFIIILAGVVLFGALMFTFSRSADKGTGNLTKQQARIAAQEILSYSKLVEGAVDRVRRNGCSENEINFNNAVVSGYSNTSAPADGSCDIFSTNGGKISFEAIPTNYFNGAFTAYSGNALRPWGEYRFTGNCSMRGVGTECSTAGCKELAVNLHFVDKAICLEINKEVGVALVAGDAPPENASSPPGGMGCVAFTGTFGSVAAGIDNGNLSGKHTACLKVNDSGNDYYFFYHVLLAR